MPFPDLTQHDAPDDGTDPSNAKSFPHQNACFTKFIFSGESNKGTEANDDDADDEIAEHAAKSRWENENRPAWERHSEKGPNLEPEGSRIPREVLQEVVNPLDHDYEASTEPLRQEHWESNMGKSRYKFKYL